MNALAASDLLTNQPRQQATIMPLPSQVIEVEEIPIEAIDNDASLPVLANVGVAVPSTSSGSEGEALAPALVAPLLFSAGIVYRRRNQ